MRITVLTVCPEMFAGIHDWVLVKRSEERGLLQLEIIDIRSFADGSFRHVDDSPYGGGVGMILRCEPVLRSLKQYKDENSHTVLFSPAGERYTQEKAHAYAGKEHLILVCGHYEGVDARIQSACDEEISVGDYVLSGGEPAALVLIDSITRLLGTIRQESTVEESFENGLLEYPQYTRPAEYEGMAVPEVLLSGNHERIRRWRREQSLRLTLEKRKDLLESCQLSDEDLEIIERIKNE